MKRAICLIVDSLHAGYLGPYGNTWVQTPAFNRLASESVLFDRAIATGPRLAATYTAIWTGVATVERSLVPLDVTTSLMAICRDRRIRTVLVTDDATVHDHPLAAEFAYRLLLEPHEPPNQPAVDWQATALAAFVAAAVDQIEEFEEQLDDAQAGEETSVLYWLHTGVLGRVWDAPTELCEQYADEDDPVPPVMTTPPALKFSSDADPDQVLGIRHVYAGQVTLLDQCLEVLLSAIDEHATLRESLFMLTAPRGYRLGEHGQVGLVEVENQSEPLYGELLRVPMIVRMPPSERMADRSQELVCSADVYATLCDWFELNRDDTGPQYTGGASGTRARATEDASGTDLFSRSLLSMFDPDREPPRAPRDYLLAVDGTEQAIMTPGWFMRISVNAAGQPRRELFVKPDDYYEVNEVSDRCREVADELAALAARPDAATELSDDARLGLPESRLP